jgi:hypothetical protein
MPLFGPSLCRPARRVYAAAQRTYRTSRLCNSTEDRIVRAASRAPYGKFGSAACASVQDHHLRILLDVLQRLHCSPLDLTAIAFPSPFECRVCFAAAGLPKKAISEVWLLRRLELASSGSPAVVIVVEFICDRDVGTIYTTSAVFLPTFHTSRETPCWRRDQHHPRKFQGNERNESTPHRIRNLPSLKVWQPICW